MYLARLQTSIHMIEWHELLKPLLKVKQGPYTWLASYEITGALSLCRQNTWLTIDCHPQVVIVTQGCLSTASHRLQVCTYSIPDKPFYVYVETVCMQRELVLFYPTPQRHLVGRTGV